MSFWDKESFFDLEATIRSRRNVPYEYRSAVACIQCGKSCVFSKLKKLDHLCCRCYCQNHKRFTTVHRCTLCLVRTYFEDYYGVDKVK